MTPCINYLGFTAVDVVASKAHLRGKKAYKQLLDRTDVKPEVKSGLKGSVRGIARSRLITQ
jgi:hypothetical protein